MSVSIKIGNYIFVRSVDELNSITFIKNILESNKTATQIDLDTKFFSPLRTYWRDNCKLNHDIRNPQVIANHVRTADVLGYNLYMKSCVELIMSRPDLRDALRPLLNELSESPHVPDAVITTHPDDRFIYHFMQ